MIIQIYSNLWCLKVKLNLTTVKLKKYVDFFRTRKDELAKIINWQDHGYKKQLACEFRPTQIWVIIDSDKSINLYLNMESMGKVDKQTVHFRVENAKMVQNDGSFIV